MSKKMSNFAAPNGILWIGAWGEKEIKDRKDGEFCRIERAVGGRKDREDSGVACAL